MTYEYVHNHSNMISNICEVCGKEFETSRPAKYCSEDCKKEARNERRRASRNVSNVKVCSICGNEFKGHGNSKYCSTECAIEGNRRLARDRVIDYEARNERRRASRRTSKLCPICGKEFIGTGRDKYCSNECSHEARLMMYRSRTDRHTECMEMFNESYAKMIYQALKRAGGKSELSGVESDDLIVHHLNGYHWDLAGRCDLANVIVLTYDEHQHFHSIYGNKFNTVEQFNEFINMY